MNASKARRSVVYGLAATAIVVLLAALAILRFVSPREVLASSTDGMEVSVQAKREFPYVEGWEVFAVITADGAESVYVLGHEDLWGDVTTKYTYIAIDNGQIRIGPRAWPTFPARDWIYDIASGHIIDEPPE